MASKNSKHDKPRSKAAARTPEQKRWLRAEEACRHAMDQLFAMQRGERFADNELAGKYAVMAGIHYRKIRNGKVLGAADFNAAVEVSTATRRCLQQLDATLSFSALQDGPALLAVLQQIDGVLADYRQLKGGKD
ncbi:hypothetical protein [Aquitalea sp. ASV15]|uniref:hypothetical protein n=1 Tax=Aquitalea sp. ASV15 TaxID=2795104 RepID=UPI0018EB201A|nr:hypothetical protein [Aquitalea sp. ASV15]